MIGAFTSFVFGAVFLLVAIILYKHKRLWLSGGFLFCALVFEVLGYVKIGIAIYEGEPSIIKSDRLSVREKFQDRMPVGPQWQTFK